MRIISKIMKLIDIGANLTDPMFQGVYHGSVKHPPDLINVLERSWKQGLDKIIITVGQLDEVNEAVKIAQTDDRLFITMGCHPTRCSEFAKDPDSYYTGLCNEIEKHKNKIVAIGECGLDYDRLNFCDKDTQKIYFAKQLCLSRKYKLPLFLHCRNAAEDFIQIIKDNYDLVKDQGGVVHSFDGTTDEAKRFIELGFYIGINGCSLKTEENINTVTEIPDDKLMIETDAPWCGIKASSAAAKCIKTQFEQVKNKAKWTKDTLIQDRNEPVKIVQVLEVLAHLKSKNVEELADIYYENTLKLFFKNNK